MEDEKDDVDSYWVIATKREDTGNCKRRHLIALSKTKLNSVALVRERTKPTERPSPVGEVSANFCG